MYVVDTNNISVGWLSRLLLVIFRCSLLEFWLESHWLLRDAPLRWPCVIVAGVPLFVVDIVVSSPALFSTSSP